MTSTLDADSLLRGEAVTDKLTRWYSGMSKRNYTRSLKLKSVSQAQLPSLVIWAKKATAAMLSVLLPYEPRAGSVRLLCG